MSKRLEEILRRKQALIALCERQRNELAALGTTLWPPISVTSIGVFFGKIVHSYPLWLTGVAGWLISRRAKLLIRSAVSVRSAWKWWKTIYPLWSLWRRIRRRR